MTLYVLKILLPGTASQDDGNQLVFCFRLDLLFQIRRKSFQLSRTTIPAFR